MKIELNIEAGQLGETVIDIFKNLTKKQKETIALEVLKEWLKEPSLFENPNFEKLLIEEYREGKRRPTWGILNKDSTDSEIQNNSSFKTDLRDFKTSKQAMVLNFKDEVVNFYKNTICSEIEKDPNIQRIKDEAYAELIKCYPDIIKQAFINIYTSNLSNLEYKLKNELRIGGL